MTEPKKGILLTGGAGRVGSALGRDLREDYDLLCFDARKPDYDIPYVIGRLEDLTPEVFARRNFDVILHLAADPHTEDPLEGKLLNPNIIGTERVYRLAVAMGVPRVIFMSSINAVGIHGDRLHKDDDPYEPENVYGATKVFGEVLGKVYAHHAGLDVLCVRLGYYPGTSIRREDLARMPLRRLWTGRKDLVAFFRLAIEAEYSGWHAVYLTSKHEPEPLSLEGARKLLRYKPQQVIGEAGPEDL